MERAALLASNAAEAADLELTTEASAVDKVRPRHRVLLPLTAAIAAALLGYAAWLQTSATHAQARDAPAEALGVGAADSELVSAAAEKKKRKKKATAKTNGDADGDKGLWGPWGFDLSGMDQSVKPGRDFYKYANGNWIKRAIIPPNKDLYSQHAVMDKQINAELRELMEQGAKEGTDIGLVYKSFMDEEQVEKLGIQPVLPILDRVRQIKNHEQFAAFAGSAWWRWGASPFSFQLNPDPEDAEMIVARLKTGDLSVSTDGYLDPSLANAKADFQKHVAKMLALVGWQDPNQAAADVVAFETKLAKGNAILSEELGPNFERMTVAELPSRLPGFPWKAFIEGAGGAPPKATVFVHPLDKAARGGILRVIDAVNSTDIGVLRSYEAWHIVQKAAPWLSKAVRDASNEWEEVPESTDPKWKQAVDKVNTLMSDAVGKHYVEKFFPQSTKAVMDKLTGLLKQAFEKRLRACTWMSDATKKRALSKLAALKFEIGRPNKFRDYARVAPDAKDMFGNVERANAVNNNFTWHTFGRPVDHGYWDPSICPQKAGGSYTNPENKAKFPAAFLHPPLFNPDGDMAVNFGGIGASIGHEITHGFDPKGRKYNEHGHAEDWWTKADADEFNHRTAEYSKQFAKFTLGLPAGMHTSANATIGEDVADLGGLHVAYDALQLWLRDHPYKPKPPLLGSDGLEADRRFFLAFAQVQRIKETDDGWEHDLATDEHSPGMARATIPFQNMDAWYAAFNIKPGDPLYLDKASRVQIY